MYSQDIVRTRTDLSYFMNHADCCSITKKVRAMIRSEDNTEKVGMEMRCNIPIRRNGCGGLYPWNGGRPRLRWNLLY